MSDVTTSTSTVAVKTAAKLGKDAIDAVTPTILETSDLTIEIPKKVLLKQPAVIVISILVGGALVAGTVYGIKKIKAKRAAECTVEGEGPVTPLDPMETEMVNTKRK